MACRRLCTWLWRREPEGAREKLEQLGQLQEHAPEHTAEQSEAGLALPALLRGPASSWGPEDLRNCKGGNDVDVPRPDQPA